MSKPTIALMTLAAAATLAACGGTSTYFTQTGRWPDQRLAKPPRAVRVHTTRPTDPYVEVGILQSQPRDQFSGARMAEMIAAMRKLAGRLGCDGIILKGVSAASGGSQNGGNQGYWSSCIVYRPRTTAPGTSR